MNQIGISSLTSRLIEYERGYPDHLFYVITGKEFQRRPFLHLKNLIPHFLDAEPIEYWYPFYA